jgi:peroxiredoxin
LSANRLVVSCTALVVALVAGAGYSALARYGRLLLRVEALEGEVAKLTDDLRDLESRDLGRPIPAGSRAPEFSLPNLDGDIVSRADLQESSTQLIFVDPACPHSRAMAPILGELCREHTNGRPTPVIIAYGQPRAMREMARDNGIDCRVLMQDTDEVGQLYRVSGTPSSCVINPAGYVISTLALGAAAVLAQARGDDFGEVLSDGYTVRRLRGSLDATACPA